MKNKKIISLALLVFAGSANAASFSYTPYSFDGETTYNELLATCGSSSNIGASSVFGASSSYPIMSQIHSEIEAMPGITSSSLSYATTRFTTALNYKNNVFGYAYDISSMVSQNGAYISATDAIYESTMSKYQESVDQLQTESDSITEMAIDDVLDDMSDNYSYLGGNEVSDYKIWSTCVGWWVAGMPYYLTDEERLEHKSRLNGWKDGELTNDPYEYPSTSISGLDISNGSYSYDRSSYNAYVTTDEDDDDYSTESSEDTSSNDSSTSSSDEWWEDSSSTDTTTSESSSTNWWEQKKAANAAFSIPMAIA